MNEFELAKVIVLKLVKDEMPFALALRNVFHKNNVDNTKKSNITALVGCELRHHLIFDNLIERFFDEVEFEKTVYLRFLLANKLFLKRFANNELFALAKQDLEEEKINSLLNFVESTEEIIPSELDKTSPEFLSLRYNTPAWVIRMWQKQYGKGVVFKTLKVNYRQSVPSLRVNENQVKLEDFIAKHPDFSKSPVEGMMIYQGRGTPKNVDEFKAGSIFYMKMATKLILDSLDLDPLKGIAIYSEVPNNVYLDLVCRFGENVALDLVFNHSTAYFETKRNVELKGYPHIFLYESSASGLLTCLSKKVHTFLCMPKSTTFDLLRSTPDYFLRIKQDQLDELIANEYSSLEEASKFIEVDGELVYMIPTLSRKESNNLIARFLVSHPEFTLVEEKQFYPFEAYDSCLYYARMKKVEE